eukprot:SAG11_NODE_831_length_6955_cov_5.280776_3_plen_233_part_00
MNQIVIHVPTTRNVAPSLSEMELATCSATIQAVIMMGAIVTWCVTRTRAASSGKLRMTSAIRSATRRHATWMEERVICSATSTTLVRSFRSGTELVKKLAVSSHHHLRAFLPRHTSELPLHVQSRIVATSTPVTAMSAAAAARGVGSMMVSATHCALHRPADGTVPAWTWTHQLGSQTTLAPVTASSRRTAVWDARPTWLVMGSAMGNAGLPTADLTEAIVSISVIVRTTVQ